MEKERKRRKRDLCLPAAVAFYIFARKTCLWRDCTQQLETDAVRFLIQVSLLSCSLSSLKASLQSLRRLWWCLTTRWMDGWVGRWVGGVCVYALRSLNLHYMYTQGAGNRGNGISANFLHHISRVTVEVAPPARPSLSHPLYFLLPGW